jgi:hypothetical protein
MNQAKPVTPQQPGHVGLTLCSAFGNPHLLIQPQNNAADDVARPPSCWD